MDENDIREICMSHQIPCNRITKAFGSFDKELFFIDDKYLLRTSKKSMLEEQTKINRIKDLNHVPKIVHSSDQDSSNGKTYYLILEYIQGCELFANYKELQDQNIQDIGIEIADFLLELHNKKGDKYDFIQILWRQGKRADELISRIKWWLNHLEGYILFKQESYSFIE